MILSIESSLPTFKSVSFHPGFNVLLADTRPESTQGQTRNSAGKSSLIEIIHFLLGARADDDSLFRTDALKSFSFIGTFTIADNLVSVSRSGEDPSKIIIISGSIAEGFTPKVERVGGRRYLPVDDWKRYLGRQFFGLASDTDDRPVEEPLSPSFRSLFSYFARRDGSGGFAHVERHSEKQQRGDYQVNLSYLLGLDWRIASQFESIRVRERTLKEVRKAANPDYSHL